ncbi:MAG: hypothetical protein FWD90_00330 [Defluviitaleaceae bacterium]|nr:hypothetical protein [Defluviitaleaceae bacterium]
MKNLFGTKTPYVHQAVTKPVPPSPAPEGFFLDPNSGQYYKAMPGKNPATGEQGIWYTWFYPQTGEYRQQFHPS